MVYALNAIYGEALYPISALFKGNKKTVIIYQVKNVQKPWYSFHLVIDTNGLHCL